MTPWGLAGASFLPPPSVPVGFFTSLPNNYRGGGEGARKMMWQIASGIIIAVIPLAIMYVGLAGFVVETIVAWGIFAIGAAIAAAIIYYAA